MSSGRNRLTRPVPRCCAGPAPSIAGEDRAPSRSPPKTLAPSQRVATAGRSMRSCPRHRWEILPSASPRHRWEIVPPGSPRHWWERLAAATAASSVVDRAADDALLVQAASKVQALEQELDGRGD